MTRKEKFEALHTVIKAYLARGNYIQYDQRCMDRVSFLTPRRIKLISPEAATSRRTLFLDCSSYVGAVYYEAFGYELPADLTWHMIDYVKPCVFCYEFTHTETEQEREALKKRFIDTLLPGDVMTYDKGVGSGHTMIYIGEGLFTHCTSGPGNPDSYDYVNKRSREYDCGGLRVDDFDALFNETRFFNPKNRRIAISRPLDLPIKPTAKTLARMTDASELWLGVESAPFGTSHVAIGESIEYTLTVKNLGTENKKITGTFTAPVGTTLVCCDDMDLPLSSGEEKKIIFTVRVDSAENAWIDPPTVLVNGFFVHAPRVLVGNKIDDARLERLTAEIAEKIRGGTRVMEAVADGYGVDLARTEREVIERYFYLHDSTSGDILTRRAQAPSRDMCVYSFFGGTGVATPEMISYPDIRINRTRRHNLTMGDVLVCSDDPYGNITYSSFYTGDALVGSFDSSGATATLTGDELDAFIDSLLGRFCFIVIRPSLA